MKIIINVEDSWIGVDGVHTHAFDCIDIDESIYAMEWDDTSNKGHIEYKDNQLPNLVVTSTSEIDAGLGITLQSILDQKDKLIDDLTAEHEAYLASLE